MFYERLPVLKSFLLMFGLRIIKQLKGFRVCDGWVGSCRMVFVARSRLQDDHRLVMVLEAPVGRASKRIS